MSAFACLNFKTLSTSFSKTIGEKYHVITSILFLIVSNVAGDSQLRDVLDNVPSEVLPIVFKDCLEQLRRHKHLEQHAIYPMR